MMKEEALVQVQKDFFQQSIAYLLCSCSE